MPVADDPYTALITEVGPGPAFLRPFNVLGRAALAIGELQLAGQSDERVLAAGLAWEHATA